MWSTDIYLKVKVATYSYPTQLMYTLLPATRVVFLFQRTCRVHNTNRYFVRVLRPSDTAHQRQRAIYFFSFVLPARKKCARDYECM